MINRNIPLTDEEEARQNQNLVDQISGLNAVRAPGLENIQNPVMAPEMTLNELADRANDPLFVSPDLLGKVEVSDVSTKAPEIKVPAMPKDDGSYKATNFADTIKMPNLSEDNTPPLSEREQLLKQYDNLIKQQDKDVTDARNSDQNIALLGALGDSLGTYLNAKGQMNVKAPGVQVKQGVGALDIAKQFQTGDKVAADLKAKREALLSQYRELAKAQGGNLTAYQQKSLDLQQQRLNLQKDLEGGREGRFRDNLSLREKQQDRISDKQLDALDSYDQTLNSFSRIKELKSQINTGPIAEKRNSMARLVGVDDPNVTALRTEILDTLATKIKALSGTAANESEVKRLAVTLPELSDNDQVFDRKLQDAEKRVREAAEIRKSSYQKQGKDVSNFKQPESQPKQEEKVIVIGPDGKANKLPKRQLEAALKQGYKLQE